MIKVTEEQEANLDKLATYLESLPKRYKHFNMRRYIESEEDNEALFIDYALKNGGVKNYGCGTVACAVGHGPAAGILFTEDLFREDYCPALGMRINLPSWDVYSYRMFTGWVDKNSNILWNWLFSADWQTIDNSHRGAAARIRYYLDKKDVPESFYNEDYGYEDFHFSRKIRKEYEAYRV